MIASLAISARTKQGAGRKAGREAGKQGGRGGGRQAATRRKKGKSVGLYVVPAYHDARDIIIEEAKHQPHRQEVSNMFPPLARNKVPPDSDICIYTAEITTANTLTFRPPKKIKRVPRSSCTIFMSHSIRAVWTVVKRCGGPTVDGKKKTRKKDECYIR